MSIVDLTDEKLGAPDVVRSNRTSMGNAVAKHADPRDGDGLSRNVFARRNEHFGRPWHDATLRNFRSAVYRRGKTVSRTQSFETAGCILSRKLFSTDVQ